MSDEIDDMGELDSIDPLMTVSEMASIIYYIGDAEILDVNAKQDCLNDCLHIVYMCNQILKAQIKEQYPIYFKSKRNAKAKNTNENTESQQRNSDAVGSE